MSVHALQSRCNSLESNGDTIKGAPVYVGAASKRDEGGQEKVNGKNQ